MSIREDFLAVRTAGCENALPREGWDAPSLGTLETRPSKTATAALKGESLHQQRMNGITRKAFSIWNYFDYSNIILQGCRKVCRGWGALNF